MVLYWFGETARIYILGDKPLDNVRAALYAKAATPHLGASDAE